MASICFPPLNEANEDGLLFIGGEATVENLITAYSRGIFPWPISLELPLTWFSPCPRGVLFCENLHINKTTKKFLQKNIFSYTINKQFDQVISECAKHHEYYKNNQYGTWITPEMIQGYRDLHQKGHAYSLEVWNSDQELVGGIYGVNIHRFYSAESMFFKESNASKFALISLINFLRKNKISFLDIQMLTETTESMGGTEISRDDFQKLLNQSIDRKSLPI